MTAETEAQALRRAVSRFARTLRSTRDPQSPTPSQLSALGTLRREGPMPAGTLAERERLQPQSVTRLIAALLERGLIRREADETDRRRSVIAITAKGTKDLQREMQRRNERLTRFLATLSARERKTLSTACLLLERMADDEARLTGEN